MAVAGKRVTVNTSATKLNSNTSDAVSGSTIVARNKDASAAVDLGGSGVTTGTGFTLAAGESVAFDLSGADDLYAVTASGTVVVHVLESSL